ncbi:MAG: SDR family NAD(P)-dependent oxidoreductase [Deltaproteobacteria bacterium]
MGLIKGTGMGKKVEDRVVVITGASSGIGREAALLFAEKRAKIVLAARREDKLRELAQEISLRGAEAMVASLDVSDASAVDSMILRAADEFGGVDILVNNAGFGQFATIEQTSYEDMREILNVNLMGIFNASKAVIPLMKARGGGHIINLSSVAGKRGFPFLGAYCATKFAICGFSEALRVELASAGIHVSVVYPVLTRTEFFDVLKNKTGKKYEPPNLFAQSARHVASAIVACAERPRAEVLPFPALRLLMMLNSIAPWVLDFILKRYYKSVMK